MLKFIPKGRGLIFEGVYYNVYVERFLNYSLEEYIDYLSSIHTDHKLILLQNCISCTQCDLYFVHFLEEIIIRKNLDKIIKHNLKCKDLIVTDILK